MHRPQLIDTTIREGQQHGDLSLTTSQALAIAHALDRFGIDWIEVGHPVISEQDALTAHALCHVGLKAQTLAHARACSKDIQAAASVGAQWVGIFAGINTDALRFKLRRSQPEILITVRNSILEAKELGLKVRFTCEDASRTSAELLYAVYDCALEAGADRISYADTVGIMTPHRMYGAIKAQVRRYGSVVHAHCHNDFGLASANSLAAFEAGAIAVDTSIEGVGERCGIARLAEVATAVSQLYDCGAPWQLSSLPGLSALLLHTVGQHCDTRPIVGQHAFTHKAGLHINAVAQEPSTYEPFAPKLVGQERGLKTSRLLGSQARKILENNSSQ